jgi:hypothetical protein
MIKMAFIKKIARIIIFVFVCFEIGYLGGHFFRSEWTIAVENQSVPQQAASSRATAAQITASQAATAGEKNTIEGESKKNTEGYAGLTSEEIDKKRPQTAKEEASMFSQQAHERAIAEAEKQNMELSSMYFINALSFSPGDIDIITDYTDMILRFAQNDPSVPADSLDALENFLNAQIMSVKPDDLPKIVELTEKVSSIRERISEENPQADTAQNNSGITEQIAESVELADSAQSIKEYTDILQSAVTLLADSGLDDSGPVEKLQAGLMMESGLSQINALIARSAVPDLAPLRMYYLQLAEASWQQIIALSVNLPDGLTKEIMQARELLDNRVNEISEERSKEAFELINTGYETLKSSLNQAGSSDQIQPKIDAINAFLRGIALKAQEISSPLYSAKLQKIMEEIQNQVAGYRTEQQKKYNKWAVGQMISAKEQAEQYDRTLYKGKFRDADSMRSALASNLSQIDTGLLNFGAMQCFNAVYNLFYSKLDNENQQRLDELMAFDEKRGLEEF